MSTSATVSSASNPLRQRKAFAPPSSSSEKPHQDLTEEEEEDEEDEEGLGSSTPLLGEWRLLAILMLVAIAVRLFNITRPDSVVFDEVHFGGFSGKYINSTFFMDVHPPLAKLMLAGAGSAAGYDGQFNFSKIRMDYIKPGVPYVAMRMLPAVQGILLVPTAYLTLRVGGGSVASATLAALAIIFENGLICQSRHIFLDASLILFTGLTILSWITFLSLYDRPFSWKWWSTLGASGLFLGLTVSCKWVGLFLIALIGLSTLKNLWDLLDEPHLTPSLYARHFLARVVCLILLPVLVYMFWFWVHFRVLPLNGPGAGFMSAEFQSGLIGNKLSSSSSSKTGKSIGVPADIAYGSKVYLRHVNTRGGYLHSHPSYYPGGSKQQQVTAYPFKDDNSAWILQKRTKPSIPYNETEREWVRNGDIIRLEHVGTQKKLHSHNHKAPVSEQDHHKEVSAYGFPEFDGDDNDLWVVEIYDWEPTVPESRDRLISIHSKFRLRHHLQRCHLFSHKVKLPKWGFEQQEVTCIVNGKPKNALWRIDGNVDSRIPPDAPTSHYVQPGFLAKFIELHQVMWAVNNGLTSSHPYESRPTSWPILSRGINFWTHPSQQVYLIGNPIIWWGSSLSLLLWATFQVYLTLRAKRGYVDRMGGMKSYVWNLGGFLTMGWFLHFLPFILMSRQLFLHHYFPALYFAILLLAVLFDATTRRLPSLPRWSLVALIMIPILLSFVLFSPYTYGLKKSHAWCLRSKWLRSWDFDCSRSSAPGVVSGTAGIVSDRGEMVEDAEGEQKIKKEDSFPPPPNQSEQPVKQDPKISQDLEEEGSVSSEEESKGAGEGNEK
ncbi:MAG: glycosyltransferase family 39 protein [Piptocephalis tieghemiana]|nr:MAG: glycosyltransferase family 39 protein [Piptocephalis tieghemiana]